jgi:Ni/Co efflux regulator RcnB
MKQTKPSRQTSPALLAATCLLLALPTLSAAQDQGDRHGGGPSKGAGRPAGAGQAPHADVRGGQGGAPGGFRGSSPRQGAAPSAPRARVQAQSQPQVQSGARSARSGSAQAGPSAVYRGYDGTEQRDNRGAGDRRGFGQDFRSQRRYQFGQYQRPSGWYAHSWRNGEILPSLFWAQNYWLNDYWMFGLSPPPYGYVWVRNGPDALLIDRTTGAIVEVIDGVFY